ncbi:ribosome-binding protein aMBF1 (putative translation factor) [Kitasatospora sp. GAS204A]|uniref:helix-turn-helix domain-containing protein n=1 Tax=unclassified Kitasatospora TaxID=2633591 RepID=UPI002476A2D9|nr:helix-turn-helix transcriptional regulator [Kitasatospora sp. GAS204B]MDH6120642.1 ribosome-binding protein aMBF1 (putative translation factor) [Kitasatospora sp. GAS204B]
MNHSRWKTARTRALLGEQVAEGPEVAALRLEIRYARAFGQALYDRRTELGLSRAEVAGRAGMAESQIEQIEGGDTVPTLPLLTRLAGALEAELDLHLAPDAEVALRFHSPAA